MMPDGPNIFVSNGTCYLGRHDKSDPAMIPCGNDYYGHVACCQANDTCLESSACFNLEFYVTYVAGCTDPEYQDASCPEKFNDGDAPWLGMSWCDDDSDTWVLCDQHDRPGTIVAPGPCACPTATARRTMAFPQLSRIVDVASLPSATGLSIAFEPGYYPTVTVPAVVTITGTAASSSSASVTSQSAGGGAGGGGIVSSVTATATSGASATPTTAQTDDRQASRLSTGATVGAAVGAAAFGILVVAIVAWLVNRRRRAKQERGSEEANNHSSSNDNNNNHNGGEEKSSSSSPPPPPPGIVSIPPVDHYTIDNNNNNNNNSNRYPEDADSIGLAYGGSNGCFPRDVARWSSPQPSELDGTATRPWSLVSELEGGGGAARPASGMEAILEQDRGQHYDHGDQRHSGGAGAGGEQVARGRGEGDVGPSELPADSIAELPA